MELFAIEKRLKITILLGHFLEKWWVLIYMQKQRILVFNQLTVYQLSLIGNRWATLFFPSQTTLIACPASAGYFPPC